MRVFRLLLIAALILSPISLLAADVVVATAPPANRSEWQPPHQSGQVWNPGHWEWNGKAYWWKRGYWLVERRGSTWIPDQWTAEGDQWRFAQGHWDH